VKPSEKLQIIVACHKECDYPNDPAYLPLHVGCEGKASIGLTGDNSGDNISKKNPVFLYICKKPPVFLDISKISEYFGNNLYLLLLTLVLFTVSAYLQVKSIGNNNTLSFKILFLSKIIQIPLSLITLRTLLNLFPQTIKVYASGNITVNPYWNKPQISFCLVVIMLCFSLLLDKKTEVFTNKQK